MGIGEFFKGVNDTMTKWGGTFYMGMLVLTILMMVLLFSWLNSKDADNSLIIGTAVLLFIPAFVFLTLWMSSVWKYSPFEQMKKRFKKAIIEGSVAFVKEYAKFLGPDGARAVLESIRAEYPDQVANMQSVIESAAGEVDEPGATVKPGEGDAGYYY